MKKINFMKFMSMAMFVLACTFAVSCVDDNDDTEAPFLDVLPSTLSFDTNGVPVGDGPSSFQISTNRHWKAIVQNDKTWVTLSATEGDGSADVEVSIPEGINDQASVTIEVSNKVGVLMSKTVTIVSGAVVPDKIIYNETFGTAAPNKSPYPFVDQYTDWVKTGTGALTTDYTGTSTSLRQSGKLSAGYTGASGGAKLFFGSGTPSFVINKITLEESETNLKLTFGASYSKNNDGTYDNAFKPEKFHFYLSADGVNWSNELTYETKQADEFWVLATSHFTLKEPTSTLYIKYAVDEASVFALDDPTLMTGPGGQEVVFDGNTVEPTTAIYNETFGTAAPNKSPYPFVDQYTDWAATGTGSSAVTYTGSSASLRQSGKLSAGYLGASGAAKLFFGTGTPSFVINNIALQSTETKLKLTFGASYSKQISGVYDNEFKADKFHVYLSADGVTWSKELTYTTVQADEFWVFATADFTLKNPTSTLYIKYAVDEESGFAIDDPTLTIGTGGQEIVFEGSTGPSEEKAITIPEMIAAMTTEQVVLDATADRFFEAVVQNDVAGGNYSFNNLILATEGATNAKNGITLYGNQVDPVALNVTKGDKVKVTLYKGLAKIVNFNGMYEVTGGQTDTWAKVEKIGSAAITPAVITADKLIEYQGMPVTIQNATTATAGIWANATGLSSHTLTSGGTSFVVFCKKGAEVFVDVPYAAATANITGLAAVNKNVGQLVPRNLSDVAGFSSSAPLITGVNPTSLSFEAAGGSKTIEVAVVNQGGNALSVSGLSGTLSATVAGTTVTVVAADNAGSAINQVLTITLAGGNSVQVPVTQNSKSSGTEKTLLMSSQDIVNGKTGNVALVSNAYGSQLVADPNTWYTWSSTGVDFTGVRIGIAPDNNGGGIQMQGNTDVSKQGRIANVTPLANIQSLVIVLRVVDGAAKDPNYSVYAGTAANPSKLDAKITGTSTQETVNGYKVFTQTFDLSGDNYSYFNIMNDLTGALYIDSIKVTYK